MNKIKTFPDPCLRRKSEEVIAFDGRLKKLIDLLREVMRSQKMGIGIAAPQLGVLQQVLIVDVSRRVAGAREHVLINPRLMSAEGEMLSHEGCMSLPEYTGYLKRYEKVRVIYQDDRGQPQELAAIGIEAICLQHEMDHLAGRLFFDHVLTLKTDMMPRHWKRSTKHR